MIYYIVLQNKKFETKDIIISVSYDNEGNLKIVEVATNFRFETNKVLFITSADKPSEVSRK